MTETVKSSKNVKVSAVADLSVGDLARGLGVSPNTVRYWLRTGRVKADRCTLGGHSRFFLRTLAKLKKRQEKGIQ